MKYVEIRKGETPDSVEKMQHVFAEWAREHFMGMKEDVNTLSEHFTRVESSYINVYVCMRRVHTKIVLTICA